MFQHRPAASPPMAAEDRSASAAVAAGCPASDAPPPPGRLDLHPNSALQAAARLGGGARWLPSLAEVVFVSVLLWILAPAKGPQALLADGDTGLHIRAGQYILGAGRLPSTDLFSFTRPQAPWVAWEWGSEVLLAAVHRIAGLAGVAVFSAAVIAATSAALFAMLLWQQVNVLVAALTMLAAASASAVHWLARPHLITGLLFAVTVWILAADRKRETAHAWWLVLLAALWANLHGGFVILPAALACYWLEAALQALEAAAPRDLHAVVRRGALLCAATAATILNPALYRLHLHIWQYLRSDFIRDRIQEFQSPQFRGESMALFELLLAAGIAFLPRCWARREYGTALLVLLMAHAALLSVRHVPLYCLVAAPVVAGEVSAALGGWKGPTGKALESLGHDYGPRAAAVRIRTPVWALAVVAITFGWFASSRSRGRLEFPREKFPQAAVAAAEERIVGRRVLTSDQWGDFLIYHYFPAQRVFIDGRSDFYGPRIGEEYLELMQADYRWRGILDRHRIEVALLPAEWPLATVLKAERDWQLDYDDGQALVLRRVVGPMLSSANSVQTKGRENRSGE